MATIDSSSTTAQITAAYLDNCGYAEDASVAMAKAFVTACVAMRVRGITKLDNAGELMEFSIGGLKELADEARRFINANAGPAAGGSGVKHVDFADFRK